MTNSLDLILSTKSSSEIVSNVLVAAANTINEIVMKNVDLMVATDWFSTIKTQFVRQVYRLFLFTKWNAIIYVFTVMCRQVTHLQYRSFTHTNNFLTFEHKQCKQHDVTRSDIY